MTKTHKRQVKELQDMIETVKEEEKKKAEEAKNDHQTFREDTKNKNLEETNHMKMLLDAR
jgi:dynein regulatory complex subunit 2